MAHFDAAAPGAVTGATLFQQVVGQGSTLPQAYLYCANTINGPRIYCTHFP
jgi:hypothetical protein